MLNSCLLSVNFADDGRDGGRYEDSLPGSRYHGDRAAPRAHRNERDRGHDREHDRHRHREEEVGAGTDTGGGGDRRDWHAGRVCGRDGGRDGGRAGHTSLGDRHWRSPESRRRSPEADPARPDRDSRRDGGGEAAARPTERRHAADGAAAQGEGVQYGLNANQHQGTDRRCPPPPSVPGPSLLPGRALPAAGGTWSEAVVEYFVRRACYHGK